jgi:general stress protein 26
MSYIKSEIYMSTALVPTDDLQKLREMVEDIDFCMLTTIDERGDLHSRPMSSNGDIDQNGDMWFFTGAFSHKVDEIKKTSRVNRQLCRSAKSKLYLHHRQGPAGSRSKED